ncbi:MAG: hypothetical protein Q8S73_28355 [Deltaproteobacteria bacterium]|nr:hypothetical protein [Myxococcales bacterium]MDP3218051.1 hypothetical protein [Deltaproteobacteria bacterium]
MEHPPTAPHAAEVVGSALAVSRLGLRARLYRAGRRTYWAAAPFILASAVLPGSVVPWSMLAALVMALCALAMVAGAVVGSAAAPRRALATLDDRGLSVGTAAGVVALPREALRDGIVVARFGRFALRLHDRAGDRYELTMPDEPTAWRWLHALGLGADQRAVRVVSDRVLLQGVVGYFLSGFAALPVMLAWMAVLAAIGAGGPGGFMTALASVHGTMFGAWAMSWLVGHVDVTVGGDGLRVSRGIRHRFIPFEALEGVARDGTHGLALRLRGQWRPLLLRFASDVDAEALAVRISAALATWRASAPPAFLAGLTVARAADAEAWRVALREAINDGSYRTAALSPADLEAVVASVAVTHAQRTGAALALRDLQLASESTGVRIASELLVAEEAVESVARASVAVEGTREGPRRSSRR